MLTKLYSMLNGIEIGRDDNGNIYYMEKMSLFSSYIKRWVVYKGDVEASSIPPAWHLWLHYTSDKIPENNKFVTPRWLKEPQANKSGSKKAYHPVNYKQQIVPDYEPWRPE